MTQFQEDTEDESDRLGVRSFGMIRKRITDPRSLIDHTASKKPKNPFPEWINRSEPLGQNLKTLVLWNRFSFPMYSYKITTVYNVL